MRKQIWIKAVSGILAGALLCTSFAGCQKKTVMENQILDVELNGTEYVQTEYSTMAESAKKEETVYINAKPDGTIYNVQVTDWLHTDTPQVRLQDISNLTEIQNVKTLTQPVVKDGALYWDMDTTDLYYSGISDAQPPITFSIRYFLNGEEKTAEEIAGQKGN
ncbi:MAG: hypothetical protein ACI4LB_05090, partial [Candidatus Fimenecus sp.]